MKITMPKASKATPREMSPGRASVGRPAPAKNTSPSSKVIAAINIVKPIPITVVVSPVREPVGSNLTMATPPTTVMNRPISPATYCAGLQGFLATDVRSILPIAWSVLMTPP